MNQQNISVSQAFPYSRRPIDSYAKTLAGRRYGPSESKLLSDLNAWNLAFLSHDFDVEFQHKDPLFTTHVRRTTQMKLDGSGLDIAGNPALLVGVLLLLPAPRFVHVIKNTPGLLPSLPLYDAYGESWLRTIEQRERLCDSGDKSSTHEIAEAAAEQVSRSAKRAELLFLQLRSKK